MLHWIANHQCATVILAIGHLLWIVPFAMTAWRLRDSRRVAARTLTPIAQAVGGQDVVVEGKVAAVYVLRSRLLDRPVAWFEWRVEASRYDWDAKPGRSKVKWVRHDGDRSTGAFAIDDGQGHRIMLLPETARVFGRGGKTWYGPNATPHGTSSIDPRNYRYTEMLLEDGDACTVSGRLEPARPEDGPGVRGVMSGGDRLPFAIGAGPRKQLVRALQSDAFTPAIYGAVAMVFAIVATIILPELLR